MVIFGGCVFLSCSLAAILLARSSPPWVSVDRPFLFLIRHNPTGTHTRTHAHTHTRTHAHTHHAPTHTRAHTHTRTHSALPALWPDFYPLSSLFLIPFFVLCVFAFYNVTFFVTVLISISIFLFLSLSLVTLPGLRGHGDVALPCQRRPGGAALSLAL